MSDGGEVMLRRLPDGGRLRALQCSWNGRCLELELIADEGDIGSGVLAEIEASDAIYFGEVRRRQGLRLWVDVEHKLDRAKLSRIQKLWNEPEKQN